MCRKNEATVHLSLISAEQSLRKVDLCEACAETHRINDPTGLSLAALLQQLGNRDNPTVE
jgi:protein-arginine kinase activator protein McsA